MSTFEATFSQLPQPILDKLQSMIRWVRRLLFIRGFFATLAVALCCVLAIMAVDAAVTIFSGTVRWVLSLTGLAITGLAAWWFLIRPLSRKITLTHIARILEIRHPELQERISTAVELMSSEDPNSIKGSEELIEAVVDSAVVDVDAVDPKTEFKPARANRFVTASAICAAIIAILLAIWPQQAWTLLTRAVAPFLDIGNAYAETMTIEPGDIRIAKGEPVTISMSIEHKRLNRAEVRRKLADGTESIERMTLMGEDENGQKKFSLTFPRVEESFQYRVRAGAAVSEYFDVEAVPPPTVEQLSIRYDYPEYTGLESSESISETGEIRALAHTSVTVTALVNKPVWTAKLLHNENREIGEPVTNGNEISWTFPLTPGMNGTWQLDLADTDGFKNEGSAYPIQTLPDKAPNIVITNPVSRELRLKPSEVLPISYSVSEDYGFSAIDMLVTPGSETTTREISRDLPERQAATGQWTGDAALQIAALKLSPNENRLKVQLRARDNRPASFDGPGEGISETIIILLDKNAQSLAKQAIDAQKKELEQAIRETKQELERAREELKAAEREIQKEKDGFSERSKQELEQFKEKAESAEEKLQTIAAKLEKSVFNEQAAALKEIAETEIPQAQESADMIPVTDDKKERVAEAQEARKNIEEALADLKKVEESIRASEDEVKALTELNDLANKQQELASEAAQKAQENAEKAQQMAQKQDPNQQKQFENQQKKEMSQFQAKQEQIQQKLGEMLKDNAAALEEVLKEQENVAQQLSEKAENLAKEQEQLNNVAKESLQKKEEGQVALTEELLNQLQKQQEKIADETKAASEAAKEQSPEKQSPEALASATEETKAAAEQLNSKNLETAAEAAKEASESLAEAASQESAASEKPKGDEAATEAPSESDPAAAPDSPENKGEEVADASDSPAGESDPSNPATTPEGESAESQAETKGEGKAEPMSETLSELAERQEALAEQIAAVQAGDLQEALALMEQQLAKESESLQAQTDAFEETLENLSQNSAKAKADSAQRALQQASSKAESAGKQLEQAQAQQSAAEEKGDLQAGETAAQAQATMQRAQPYQQQAQSNLEQAAKALAQSAETIGQTLEGLEPSDMDQPVNSEDLAQSFEDVTDAAQSENAEEAASESQEAANSLQELAQAAMKQMGNMTPGDPGQQNQGEPSDQQQQQMQADANDPSQDLNETGQKTADANGLGIPPELQKLGISIEDWTRFKGALSSGSATSIETDLPAEYRELVGRYFQVIAKEAGKKE